MHVMRHFCDIDFGFVWTVAALCCDGGDDNQIMKKCWFNLLCWCKDLALFILFWRYQTHTDRYRCAWEIGLNWVKKKFSVSTIDGYVARFPLDIFCIVFFYLLCCFVFFYGRFCQAIIKWWFRSLSSMCFFFARHLVHFFNSFMLSMLFRVTRPQHTSVSCTLFSSSSMIYFPSLSNVARLRVLLPVAMGDRFRSFVRFALNLTIVKEVSSPGCCLLHLLCRPCAHRFLYLISVSTLWLQNI